MNLLTQNKLLLDEIKRMKKKIGERQTVKVLALSGLYLHFVENPELVLNCLKATTNSLPKGKRYSRKTVKK